MKGFQNLVLRGLGLSAVLLPAGLLLAYAARSLGWPCGGSGSNDEKHITRVPVETI